MKVHSKIKEVASGIVRGKWAVVHLLACFLVLGSPPAAVGQEGTAVAEPETEAVQPSPSDGASISEILEDESFHYDPAGKRDPFRSLMELTSKKVDPASLPPIQRVDLKKIKITGVVLDELEGHRAMIKSDTGKTFVVKKGMTIGKNRGEVIEVGLQGIRVVEKFEDFMGQETLKEMFIKVRPTITTGN